MAGTLAFAARSRKLLESLAAVRVAHAARVLTPVRPALSAAAETIFCSNKIREDEPPSLGRTVQNRGGTAAKFFVTSSKDCSIHLNRASRARMKFPMDRF
ncbi:MAG: hypothetical protein DME44_06380 [Verrucomicrobia bacterium]|nr:MAG: hypothetical protein DME44_06380 [Verrucomicrobiota bacterium]